MFGKIFGKLFNKKQKEVQNPQDLIIDKEDELTDEEMQQMVGGGQEITYGQSVYDDSEKIACEQPVYDEPDWC